MWASLPTVSFVVPDEQNDMHDGTVAMGDTWLSQNIEAYRVWASTHNSVLIVTWDEDDSSQNNQIPTIITGQNIRPGNFPESSIERAAGVGTDHFNMLRTFENLYGLGTCVAAADGSRNPIVDLFRAPLLNIATRDTVQTAAQVLIAGFIITGTDQKQVLIRGIGPSLTGVGATLRRSHPRASPGQQHPRHERQLEDRFRWVKPGSSHPSHDHSADERLRIGDSGDLESWNLHRHSRRQEWRDRRRGCGALRPGANDQFAVWEYQHPRKCQHR